MSKCPDCGRFIDPRRGFCTFYVCHNKLIGGPTPEPLQQKSRGDVRRDFKRCPFCAGRQGPYTDTCFLSACTRGPLGRSCGCHYLMAGMGTPGAESRVLLAARPRHIGAQAGGGARTFR